MGRWIEEHNCDPISTRPTLPEAIWTLGRVGANASHGLRRTNDDKRRAVLTLLNDLEWAKWSDREIARACGVTHPFVAKQRADLSGNGYQIEPERTVTRNGTTYQQNTADIGASSKADQIAPEPETSPAYEAVAPRLGGAETARLDRLSALTQP